MTSRWLPLGLVIGLAACAPRTADIGCDGALVAVDHYMADLVPKEDPAEYDATVSDGVTDDGRPLYRVQWKIKQVPMAWMAGGIIVFWVEPTTGKVLRSDWYQ